MLICEECKREYIPAKEGQRWCTGYCVTRWHVKNKKPIPTIEIKRICPVCGDIFAPRNVRTIYCKNKCRIIDYRSSLRAKESFTPYDTREASHKLPCLRCKLWVVNPESENGGYCTEGRWRICKPYMPNVKPYQPINKKEK
jgi:hypothetical protein